MIKKRSGMAVLLIFRLRRGKQQQGNVFGKMY